MPTKAKLYIGATVALGFVVLAGSLLEFRQFPDLTRFLAYASLACIASTLKVRLPGLHGTISLNFVFILMAITQLSLTETLLLAFVATMVQCLWRPKTHPKFIQVLFNASTVLIGTALAYAAIHALPGKSHLWISLAPAATVFFVINTGMISMVLALLSSKPVLELWRRCHLWTFPYYLVGAAIAGAASATSNVESWRISLLALPLMYLVYSYYSIYINASSPEKKSFS